MPRKYKYIDITGQRFGKLIALKRCENNYRNEIQYECLCDCGKTKSIPSRDLRRGLTKSCGCYQNIFNADSHRKEDIIGQKFTRLTVINYIDKTPAGTRWKCRCDCGKEIIVARTSLQSKNTLSCGCLKKELDKSKIGPLHPGWNPNLTDDDRIKRRFIIGYKDWQFLVKKRDNFTCQVCLQYKGSLISHHLESYHANKELRLEISNGICLCKSCHKEFHKRYGMKNNTKSQFEDFVKKKKENYW